MGGGLFLKTMFWLQRCQNVYRLRSQPVFSAPVERNVLKDDYVEPYISLRWSEEPYKPRSL